MQKSQKKMKMSSPNNTFLSVSGQKNNMNTNNNSHYLNSEATLVSSSSSLLSDNISSVPMNEQDSAATLASLSMSTRDNYMAVEDINAAATLQRIPSSVSNFDSPNQNQGNSNNGNSKQNNDYHQLSLQFSNPELMKLVYGLCERVGKLEDEVKMLKVNDKSNF